MINTQLEALDEQDILDYLMRHPDFFVRHSAVCERMMVPHPVRESVSLVEWSLIRHRKTIEQKELEIQDFHQMAEKNHVLFSQLLHLLRSLLEQPSLDLVLGHLNRWAKLLGLASADIRLFSDKWCLSPPSSFHYLGLDPQRFHFIRTHRLRFQPHYLGVLSPAELAVLAPNTDYVGSVALSLLGQYRDLGVIIFTSRDRYHYHDQQGTLLLAYLSDILPLILARWLKRR